jgi:hypothetical protein
MDEVKTGLLYWVQDEFRGNLFTANFDKYIK